MKIINPATEQLIREVEEDSPSSITGKFEKAKEAQKAWAQLPLPKRLEPIKSFRALIVDRTERLARITTSEVGKPIKQSRSELQGLLGRIDFFIENAARVLRDETVFCDLDQGLEEKIVHEPLGVIANISAWNYPYYVGSNVFIPALLCGNAVLYKPSEFATLTGLAIADLLHEAGIPTDIFIPIVGSGTVGAELLQQPLGGVFFTGSHATGKKIATTASGRMIKTQLELGGKDPIYVADDVDARTAAEAIADGAFYNCGQSCCSVERIYVHERVYGPFLQAFVETVKNFVIGDPADEKTYIGPLTRGEHLQVLERQTADALAKGAKTLCGGKRITRPGFYFEPTVFIGVNHTMELMREETFGPMIGIQRVSGDDEAMTLMNDTVYGLTAGVYTKTQKRAERILRNVNAGSAYWNCCDRVSPRLPWSGRGHSGIGTTLSTHGILTFVQPKAWHLRGESADQ